MESGSEAERGDPVIRGKWSAGGFICLRLLVGGLFIYSGILKVSAPLPFADSIVGFQIVPPFLVSGIAIGLPPLEIFLGAMLVSGWQARAASFGVLILSVLFFLILLQALARGLQVDCGCFGSGEPSVLKMWMAAGRDALLIAASVCLYRSASEKAD